MEHPVKRILLAFFSLALSIAALGAADPSICGAAPAKKSAPSAHATSPPPAASPAPAAGKAAPASGAPRRIRYIGSVPDTGQFLPDTTWLLQVGPRVTRVGDYIERWFGAYPEFRPPPDSLGRVKFMESLVNKDVMALTALALDHPLGFEDRLALRETRLRSLATAVYQGFVRDSV